MCKAKLQIRFAIRLEREPTAPIVACIVALTTPNWLVPCSSPNAMLIKQADDKKPQIAALEGLLARPDATGEIRKRIEQEIRNIRSGAKGEADAAYEIGFHYGETRNWAVIHDLRLECGGQVAQIDHILINRALEFWVCESKRFAEGIGINEHGEFSAFYGGRPSGIPSPLEQNKKHVRVLEAVFDAGLLERPTWLFFKIPLTFRSLVLVSKNARISRPRKGFDGLDDIVKADQIQTRVDHLMQKSRSMEGTKVSPEALERLARSLAALHRPIEFNWPVRFGLPPTPPATSTALVRRTAPAAPVVSAEPVAAQVTPAMVFAPADPALAPAGEQKKGVPCAACAEEVPSNVAWYCRVNKHRFGGAVYCRQCQKDMPTLQTSAAQAQTPNEKAEPAVAPPPAPAFKAQAQVAEAPEATADSAQAPRHTCSGCSAPVELKVVRFCRFNQDRFGGRIYCRACQVSAPASA